MRHSARDERILLTPDLLINLAASYLLQAQANEKGLGALDEARVLRNSYKFSQVKSLHADERAILLNAVIELFLRRNICAKYENNVSPVGSVVAAEVDLLNNRMIGTEEQKASIIPLLQSGDEAIAFPPLLQRRVYGDFRQEEMYFIALFDLVLTLYQVAFEHPIVQDLRAELRKEVRKKGK